MFLSALRSVRHPGPICFPRHALAADALYERTLFPKPPSPSSCPTLTSHPPLPARRNAPKTSKCPRIRARNQSSSNAGESGEPVRTAGACRLVSLDPASLNALSRRKKIKCDGTEPVCSQCSSSSAQCTWLQTKDRAALSRQYVPITCVIGPSDLTIEEHQLRTRTRG